MPVKPKPAARASPSKSAPQTARRIGQKRPAPPWMAAFRQLSLRAESAHNARFDAETDVEAWFDKYLPALAKLPWAFPRNAVAGADDADGAHTSSYHRGVRLSCPASMGPESFSIATYRWRLDYNPGSYETGEGQLELHRGDDSKSTPCGYCRVTEAYADIYWLYKEHGLTLPTTVLHLAEACALVEARLHR